MKVYIAIQVMTWTHTQSHKILGVFSTLEGAQKAFPDGDVEWTKFLGVWQHLDGLSPDWIEEHKVNSRPAPAEDKPADLSKCSDELLSDLTDDEIEAILAEGQPEEIRRLRQLIAVLYPLCEDSWSERETIEAARKIYEAETKASSAPGDDKPAEKDGTDPDNSHYRK